MAEKCGGLTDKNSRVTIEISRQEHRLLEELRKIPFGEVAIFMRDGEPARIELVKESIRLD